MKLNDLNFVEINSEKITNDLINFYEEYTGESLPTGSEKRIFLQGISYVIVGILNNINATGKRNLLRYADGIFLRALGELLGVEELTPEAAKTTLQFTLSNAQVADIVIPQGTRVTADGSIFFATDEELTIKSGVLNGTITATATVTGTQGNGFVIGQINKIVDGVPYVASVTNTTESADGRDLETDNEYRERTRLAPHAFSTAGAENAYKYLAYSANINVGDVGVHNPSDGVVQIAIVKKDGTIPETGDEILTDVENACTPKTARPLTDKVVVLGAAPVEDNIEIKYFIHSEDSADVTKIQEAVTKAVAEYKLWQTTKIGRDINPDRLKKLVLNAGADSVEIIAPVATEILDGEVAQFGNVTITYGGMIE